jgi:Protein of unknown function (DUF2510)
VSYRPPPGDRDDAAGRQPPGWYLDPRSYLDPAGQQVLRWWDGTQWGQQTQPLPGRGHSPQAQSYGQLPGSPSGHYGRPPRNSWPRRHKALTVLGGLVALIIIASIAAAAGHQTSPSASTSGVAAAASSAAASSPTTTRASDSPATGTSNDTLTGFGATVSAWNAHHVADTKFAPNAAYNPDPALPSYSGQDVYVAVLWQDGRALNYQMNIPGQSIRDAIARARHFDKYM